MYIDLVERLPQEDKIKIENFIYSYGIIKDDFMGLEDWLQNWSHSNQTLYKLMGEKFIISFPIEIEKDEKIIEYEISNLFSSHPIDNIIDSLQSYCHNLNIEKKCDDDVTSFLQTVRYNPESLFVKNKTTEGFKVKFPFKKSILQINENMNATRALKRVLDYFAPNFIYDTNVFEDFRTKLSMIYMDNKIEGEFCISIHPLDFMTMSSNSLNWCSCMSWTKDGCYKIGTVEMMNSNNVICCYLKTNEPYNFNVHYENDPTYQWNNKKWRNLYYINKDILLSGKSYPFYNETLTKVGIENIYNLAKTNLHYHYSYGIMKYTDMESINSSFEAYQEAMFDENKKRNKKIYIDTNGMYNDIYNNLDYNYWCYRNPVKISKRYNVSGKAPCLKCGDSVIEVNDDNNDILLGDYNDRYNNTDSLLCETCKRFFYCRCCDQYKTTERLKKMTIKKRTNSQNEKYIEKEISICRSCYNNYIRKCPCCGEPFFVFQTIFDTFPRNQIIYYYNCDTPEEINEHWNDFKLITFFTDVVEKENKYYKDVLYMCENCYLKNYYNKNNSELSKVTISNKNKKSLLTPSSNITYCILDDKKASPYRYKNLEPVIEIPNIVYVSYCSI